MTPEKLIKLAGGKSVAELEAMSDIEIENYFRPFFDVTRPVAKPKNITSSFKKPTDDKPVMLNGKVLSPEQAAKWKMLQKKFDL